MIPSAPAKEVCYEAVKKLPLCSPLRPAFLWAGLLVHPRLSGPGHPRPGVDGADASPPRPGGGGAGPVFRPASPRAPFLGLPLQWGLALLLSQPLGDLLGFRLGSFAWDLFDWIAYGIFIVGWSVGAALVQFVTLFLLERRARP